MREGTGSVKRARNGAYIHVLRYVPAATPLTLTRAADDFLAIHRISPASPVSIERVEIGETRRAAPERIHEVYSALLESLQLTSTHRESLLGRGLSEVAIGANGYKSLPSWEASVEICKNLSCRFDDLSGVPGFYFRDGNWLVAAQGSGFFIPYRDALGKITGLQIRYDQGETRYKWFSSSNLKSGISSGSPLHFSKPEILKQSETALITEGALKADVISCLSNTGCIAIAGVTSVSPEKTISQLREALPDLRRIVIAFDMDFITVRAVRESRKRWIEMLLTTTYDVEIKSWPLEQGKGYDDYLYQIQGRIH